MSCLPRPRLLLASLALVFAAAMTAGSSPAAAHGFDGLGFLPYGFYQPYGARYGTSIRTPPYFATNPPVYYGARHARPYGISPFAAPPMAAAGPGYRSRLDSGFMAPPASAPVLPNPCVSTRAGYSDTQVVKKGEVQLNPFVESSDRLAKK
jgi:hypothetical protein